MNVLLTCAGRRNYLVSYFKDALHGRGRVFAADASPDAPAMHEADQAFVVPRLDAEGYVDVLLSICANNDIGMVLSLNDLELPILARRRAEFLDIGTIPVVSSPEVVEICADKWMTATVLSSWGVPVPRTYLSIDDAEEALHGGELRFPVVVKPRWGTASIGIEVAADREELELAYRMVGHRVRRSIVGAVSSAEPERAVLVQQCMDGPEYGIDIINDLQGNHVTTIVKRKLAMRAGETDRAVTQDEPRLRLLGEILGRRLRHVGNLDCDVFLDGDTFAVLEMNPRFGGGYPFSHVAGADLPACLIAWATGRREDERWLNVRPDVVASKFDRLVVADHGFVICEPVTSSTAGQ